MFIYVYKTADIVIKIDSDILISVEKQFDNFLVSDILIDYTVNIRKVDKLRELPSVYCEEICYRVYKQEEKYIRSFFNMPTDTKNYAVAVYDYKNKTVNIEYLSEGQEFIREMSNIFFILGFEGILIQEEKICLHASFVDTKFGGILFSGPSGIGKSTQADLWCKYADARLINGDRPILGKKKDGWYAWGSPYAGSSKCYINESQRISAIIILEQADHCSLQKLGVNEAYRSIYAGLTVNSWNSEFALKAFDTAVLIAKEIPVYKLSCTPDYNAVDILQKQLRRDLRFEPSKRNN